jgi:predicted metal-dependent HD superfamily phosphohydrolase
MLARPRLFGTDVLAARLEAPARANLLRSLSRLRS